MGKGRKVTGCGGACIRIDRRVTKRNRLSMENVILTVHLILALLLIGVVLLQRSEGGGLGMGGGGVMSNRGAATALTKLTWILAAAFICTSITLTLLASGASSVLDSQPAAAQPDGTAAPAAPASPLGAGSDLLPPAPADAPAAPPRAGN